jgi:hypothetical protein
MTFFVVAKNVGLWKIITDAKNVKFCATKIVPKKIVPRKISENFMPCKMPYEKYLENFVLQKYSTKLFRMPLILKLVPDQKFH